MKYRRALVGLSQDEVATHLGITFQQVQKYENGKNRISAGRLLQVAELLRVPVQWFYEGLNRGVDVVQNDNGEQRRVLAFALTSEGARLTLRYLNAPSARHRKVALDVLSLSTEHETE